MLNRRSFIQKMALGFIAINLPTGILLSAPSIPPPSKNIEKRLIEAASKRKRGRINQSIRKYRSIIEDFPSEIRAYDGLRKSLILKKNKELAILKLYKSGLVLNPNNPMFKERLAREYTRIALGNKKILNEVKGGGNLLKKAKKIGKELCESFPEKQEYTELLKKIKIRIKQNTKNPDCRRNNYFKKQKHKNRKNFKKRFDSLSLEELEKKLNKLLNAPFNEDRKVRIKELYKILIRRSKKEKNYQQAFIYAKEYYNFDKTESFALCMVKRFARKSKNYDDLLSISEENHLMKNTFWSNIARFDAHFFYLRKEKSQENLNKLKIIVNELTSQVNSQECVRELLIRKIRLGLKTKEISNVEKYLLDFFNLYNESPNLHNVVIFTILASKYYKKKNDITTAINIIDYALGNKVSAIISDNLSEKIFKYLSNINIEKDEHKARLNRYRNRLLTKNDQDD